MPYLFLFILLFSASPNKPYSKKTSVRDTRDGQTYDYVVIGNLKWLKQNLQHKTSKSSCTDNGVKDLCEECGQFYPVEEALKICPEGWRLPTEQEVKELIKLDRRHKINLVDTLNIRLCGRMDYGKTARVGEQNTFWIDSELKDGNITHWHTFGNEHELHNHNVVVAKRQFPVRCVCELENQDQ